MTRYKPGDRNQSQSVKPTALTSQLPKRRLLPHWCPRQVNAFPISSEFPLKISRPATSAARGLDDLSCIDRPGRRRQAALKVRQLEGFVCRVPCCPPPHRLLLQSADVAHERFDLVRRQLAIIGRHFVFAFRD